MERKINLPNITPFGIENSEIKPAKTKKSGQTKFFYGKYKGRLVNDVIKSDPSYVAWLTGNDKRFKLSEEQTVLLADYLDKYDKCINNQ